MFDLHAGLAQKSRFGIYVHVPFCPHICPYCDFVKTSRFTKSDVNIYFENLRAQLHWALSLAPQQQTHCTVYFGGGTPGLFAAQFYAPLLEAISSRFTIEECTLETNPFTNAKAIFGAYKSIGINRITLGAQSLCNKTLSTLGRKHTAKQVIENLEWAKAAGIEQVQVDLIYGLSQGTRTLSLEQEITDLARRGATGISAYALTLEERTLLANSGLADESIAAQEYEALHQTCTDLGMTQRETSNFSFYEAMHNNIYWYGLPYFGIGTGAHGLLPGSPEAQFGTRFKVGSHITERSPGDDNLNYVNDSERLFKIEFDSTRTRQQYIDEMIFTLLRTPVGIPLKWLESLCGTKATEILKRDAKIRRAIDEGKASLNESQFALHWQEKLRGDSWSLHLCSLFN